MVVQHEEDEVELDVWKDPIIGLEEPFQINEEDLIEQLEEEEEETPQPFPLAPITLLDLEEKGEDYCLPPWNYWYILGFFVFAFLVGIFSRFLISGSESLLFVFFFLSAVQWFVDGGVPSLLSYQKGNGPMIDFGITRRPKDFIIGVGVGVVGFIVSWVLGILSQNLMGFMPEGVIGVLIAAEKYTLIKVVLVLMVFPGPIFQEILFRGFIFFIFAKHRLHPAVITIYITILSFLTHLIFKKFVIIFALETLLTITRIYCQSITPCIVGHVVMNFFLVIVSVAWPLGNLWLFSY